jgi:hypothetical protein
MGGGYITQHSQMGRRSEHTQTGRRSEHSQAGRPPLPPGPPPPHQPPSPPQPSSPPRAGSRNLRSQAIRAHISSHPSSYLPPSSDLQPYERRPQPSELKPQPSSCPGSETRASRALSRALAAPSGVTWPRGNQRQSEAITRPLGNQRQSEAAASPGPSRPGHVAIRGNQRQLTRLT